MAAYGKNVEKAMELGAVDTLLICDFLEDSEIKRLGNLCENQGGDWTIIDSSTRDGNTLKGLGGIGAILRYKLTFNILTLEQYMLSKNKLEKLLPNKNIRISKEYLEAINDKIESIIKLDLIESYKYAQFNGRITLKRNDLK